MATTTMGVKVDKQMRQRLIRAAKAAQCTPHWLMKNAMVSWVESLEAGAALKDLTSAVPPAQRVDD